MADKAFPFPEQTIDFNDFTDLMGPLTGVGVLPDPANGLQPFGDSTGLQVKVRPGKIVILGRMLRLESVAIRAVDGGSGLPRVDAVIARRTTTDITIVVKKGTPAASPVAPSLEQSPTGVYEVLLGTVAVSASAATITAANVTDRRQSPTSLLTAGWQSYAPIWNASGGGASYAHVISGRFRDDGRTVDAMGSWRITGGGSPGSGRWRFSLPFVAASDAVATVWLNFAGQGWFAGSGLIEAGSSLIDYIATTQQINGSVLGPGASWSTGTQLRFSARYER